MVHRLGDLRAQPVAVDTAVGALMGDLHVGQGQLHPPLAVVGPLRHQRGLHALLVQVEVEHLGPTGDGAAEVDGVAHLESSEGG